MDCLRIFVPVAVRALFEKLAPRLEAVAGQPILLNVDLNPAIPERIAAGEPYDLALSNPHYVKPLIREGRVEAASHRAFGRVPLAVGGKTGTAGGLRTETDAIAGLLREAENIAYTGAGTSGHTFHKVLDRMGLTEEILRKSRAMGGGEPVRAVVTGESSLAIAPLSTLIATPGVEPVAIFPDDLGAHIDMTVFLPPGAEAGAQAVHAFLSAPALDAELAAAGLVRFVLD
ncbi:substrate-binding domain-containing protein [Thioclava pacifica]|uniref:Molybdate ABC transporter substrate-binding protein n=1 Tax=Thioclava pacifica DSM 10166 TaxID=1353537 RepID=A0A074JH14_9RHOB|nr:substrate-binding domain-containing protein [Thioclava pacifica]KEO55175.1 hypothetical protein TP2_16485 [Thioclava pacifica DSM 10166]